MSNTLIILAHSARALAESAARAGFRVITIDGFADLDTLEASVESVCLPLKEGTFVEAKLDACLERVTRKYPDAKILPGAGADYLVSERALPGYARLAASAEFIEQVIRPQAFFDCLDRLSIPYPEVSYQQPPANESWLYKQAFSCGGVGVSTEYAETPGYWQKRISGTPVSTLCIADPHQIRVIGFNQQLTESLFPDVPYAYAGAIANHRISEKNRLKIEGYLIKLRKEIDFLGVFSVDMIVADEQCYILEINPRISASFELYERLNPGLNLVDAHNGVCEGERLPEFRLSAESCAYRIVYAKKALLIPAGIDWPEWVKDRPETGRIIQCYEPICSLYASAAESQVQARLKQYEQELYVIINNKL